MIDSGHSELFSSLKMLNTPFNSLLKLQIFRYKGSICKGMNEFKCIAQGHLALVVDMQRGLRSKHAQTWKSNL